MQRLSRNTHQTQLIIWETLLVSLRLLKFLLLFYLLLGSFLFYTLWWLQGCCFFYYINIRFLHFHGKLFANYPQSFCVRVQIRKSHKWFFWIISLKGDESIHLLNIMLFFKTRFLQKLKKDFLQVIYFVSPSFPSVRPSIYFLALFFRPV